MSINIVMVGISGYASTYADQLISNMDSGEYSGKYRVSGVVDIAPEKSYMYESICKNNIPVFKSLEEYFDGGRRADLVFVLTPPFLHAQQTITALENGANVLSEKPVSPLYKDALLMKEKAEEKGKFVGIGYQWSYSDTMCSLKRDILEGKLGKPVSLKSFVSWPRGRDYYSGWRGKIKGDNGEWILDAIASNAAAHHLHNMYFLLGDEMDTSAFPTRIKCELLRANEIESYDTCVMRIETTAGAELFYAASHATGVNDEPQIYMQFENAAVKMNIDEKDNHVYAIYKDGTVKDYGNPGDGLHNRIWRAIDAVIDNKPLTCTVKTAIAHTLTVDKAFQFGKINSFPKELIAVDEENGLTTVIGLYGLLREAFDKELLLSEMGVKWAECSDILV